MATLIKYSLLNGQARAHVLKAADIAEAARCTHNASRVGAAALGRLLMAGVLLSDQLKNDGQKLTLTVNGGGPLGRLIVTAYDQKFIKGYADNPEADLSPRPDGKLDVGGAVGHAGHITLVSDMMMRELYVSRASLVSGEIAEDVAHLLSISMQRPAIVTLGVMLDSDGRADRVVAAGGALIEPIPGAEAETLEVLNAHVPMLGDISAKARDARDGEALGATLLCGLEPIALDSSHPEYACDCSRERIEQVLMSMGRAELEDMIDKQGGAELVCHFCTARYTFTEDELKHIMNQ